MPAAEPSAFESACDAIVAGNAETLAALLNRRPDLIRCRSTRPHHATLLHYLSANGVEQERQRSPANAPALARQLLRAGAEPDAVADMYGAQHTPLCLLTSSTPPAAAGVQSALIEALLDGGARLEGACLAPGGTSPCSPLLSALGFGHREAARTLVRRGAAVNSLAAAAGLGDFDKARELLAAAARPAPALERQRALALAAQHGHLELVRLMLDAGANPNLYNPAGFHSHSTPLHQAALAGHLAVVQLLVHRGARADIPDRIYHGSALDWAVYGRQAEVEAWLRSSQPDGAESS